MVTTSTLSPWDALLEENNDIQWPTSTEQTTTTTWRATSTTEGEEEEEVSSSTTTPSPLPTTTRRVTTTASRGTTRHTYHNIRQNNSPRPSTPKEAQTKAEIFFRRRNETLSTTTTTTRRPTPSASQVPPRMVSADGTLIQNAGLVEQGEVSNSLSSASQLRVRTTRPPAQEQFLRPSKDHYLSDSLEDAALLEIDQQLDNWDSGLLRASAGAGSESSTASPKPESKKTLSDQVAEGKYALIQTELFEKPAPRPGVLSYEKNPEVPKDTASNLGGLTDDEIWLAEDHLLILRGGALAAGDKQSDWVPIDAYEAPPRPVKIPAQPEVPPPFPVQLDEGGPVQFIGDRPAPFPGAFPHGPLPPAQGPFGGTPTAGGQGGDPQNVTPWPGQVQNFTVENGYEYPPPPGHPFLNYGPPPPPLPTGGSPFGVGVPPPFFNGSLENSNQTLDYPDEDDPSLYYPPPYSFVYKSNYSNPVPPGPLVPGIVLPPPPNFFTRLEGSLTPSSKGHGNRTALRRRPPPRVPIVRPHQTASEAPVAQVTRPTTTNVPPSARRPTTTRLPTTTTTLRSRQKQPIFVPPYKENVVLHYEAPSVRPKPLVPEYEDHYQNTVEQPPVPVQRPSTVTQLKKVQDPLTGFVGPQGPPSHGHPVYFEYFESQKGNQPRTSTPGPHYIPIPVTTSSTTTTQPPPPPVYDYGSFSYVTPRPEIHSNGEPPQLTIHTQPDIVYQRLPVDPPRASFNHEVETIRQTLNYFQAKPQLIPLDQQRPQEEEDGGYLQNQLQRTPKAKPVYQYSFEAEAGGRGSTSSTTTRYPSHLQQSSIRPGLLDTTPFKPMVQYSAPLNSQADRDGFKPFASYFSSTPAATPLGTTTLRPTKTRSKLLPVVGGNSQPLGRPQQFHLNGDHLYNLQFGAPLETPTGPGQAVRGSGFLRNVKQGAGFSGYFYDQPLYQQQQQQQGQQGQSVVQHHTAVDPYMAQIAALRQKLRHHSTFHEFYQHPNLHFNGSSSLRFYPGQTTGGQRTNSRYTDHAHFRERTEQRQNLLHVPSAPGNGQSQYYSRIQNHPQTAQQQQQQQEGFLSLEKDILVNYKYPLPAANPDAETLPADFLEQHRRPSTQQRPVFFSPPQQPQQTVGGGQQFYQYRLPGDEAHVYFLEQQQQRRTGRQAKAMREGEEKDKEKEGSKGRRRRRRK